MVTPDGYSTHHSSTPIPISVSAIILERHGDEAQKRYPEAKVVRDLESLLRESSVHLIVVATPNTSHLEIAAQALQAGKHVVVDKPFTITSADADELIAISKKVGRVLSVFQNRRWDGDFLTVRQILDQGKTRAAGGVSQPLRPFPAWCATGCVARTVWAGIGSTVRPGIPFD